MIQIYEDEFYSEMVHNISSFEAPIYNLAPEILNVFITNVKQLPNLLKF